MLLDNEVEITINSRNMRYLESIGYDFSGYKKPNINGKLQIPRGIKIKIKTMDLQRQSITKVRVLCDYCNENVSMKQFNQWLDCRKIIQKDCCDNTECMKQKRNEVNLRKYGVINPLQREIVKNKLKQTNLKNLGSEWATQNEHVKNKVKETNLQKYGVDNVSKSETIKVKKQKTCIEHFGVPNPLQSEINKEKSRHTNIEKYGVEYIMQNKELKNKANNTMYRNGTVPCSKQQLYLNKIINYTLNYPVLNYNLDMANLDEKIYIEYDGGAHNLSVKLGSKSEKDFKYEERKRWYCLYSKGWKEIRIFSYADKLPTKDKIIEMINYAKEYLNKGHHYIKFDIDNGKVINSQGIFNYEFGVLKKIKNKDIIINN